MILAFGDKTESSPNFSPKSNFFHSSNIKSDSLSIYGNVKTESIQGNIMADNLEFDLDSKTLDISMFDKKNSFNQLNISILLLRMWRYWVLLLFLM